MEAEKYYSDAFLNIFEDESRTKFISVQSLVQQFKKTFEDDSPEEDIRQAFRTKEVLLKLDTKLDIFVDIRMEISNYW